MKLHLPKGLRTALIAAISLFSGFAATVGSAAYADSFLPSLENDQSALALTWRTGSMPGGWDSGLTTAKVKTGITNFDLSNPGWYGFLGNGQNAFSTDPKLLKTDGIVSGFSFCGRYNYNGEAIVSVVSVQDILSGTTDNTLTSFSVSFDGSAASNGLYFSAWAWDGTEATQLVGNSKIDGGAFTVQTFSANDLNLKESDKILLSWWNNNGGSLNTVTNISTTFTSKYDAANDPPRDLTWEVGRSCNWADEIWTCKGTKVTFKDGDNIYFPKLDSAFSRISVDGDVVVGNITVQAGNMDTTTISGTAASNMTAGTLSLDTNAELAFAGFANLTFKSVTTKSGAEVDVSSVTGKLSITEKLTGAAENTIILTVIADSITTEAPDLYLAGSYANPDEIKKAVTAIASLNTLADKGYIDESDVDNLGLMGTIIFTDKQSSVQPAGNACTLDIDKRKVVFDKGISLYGYSYDNGSQSLNVKNRGEMTVNGEAFGNLRMTVNVTTGGKLTATEGIILGHPENGDYPAWLNLKSAEITTKTITSRNRDARTAFTMSSEVYQLPGNPRPTEQGGTLTITGDSAFGLLNDKAKFKVNLNAGTLTSTATSMNLVDATYAESANITISVGGTFNIAAKDGCTITINHALSGGGTGTGTASGTLVFNGAGTVAIADGVDLGEVSFNQADGTLSLAGPITLGDTATFTQAAGKKILLTAIEGVGGGGSSYDNYTGGATGNGVVHTDSVNVITGGTLEGDVVVTYNGTDYTLTNDNRGIGGEGATTTTYHVNTATADMSKITAFSADITTVELAGGNLILDTAKPDTVALNVTGDSTLTINEGVTVNKTDVTVEAGKTLTLAGEGTYASSEAALGATLGTAWTGTVKLMDCTLNNLSIDAYATKGSSVELSGANGYLRAGGSKTATYVTDLILTNSGDKAGYSITNSNSDATNVFNGKISGTGDFARACNTNGTQFIKFGGDVSDWTGNFIVTSATNGGKVGLTDVEFNGNATEINASIVQQSGKALAVGITNDNAVVFNGTIGADGGTGAINITMNGTGAKTFNSAVGATALTVNAGSAIIKDSLTATGTVTVGSGATLDLRSATSATVGTLDLAGGSTLALGSGALTVTNLTLTGVSGTSLLTIQGLGTDAVIFTGLAAETNISNITFVDKQGKRVASAANYITGASGWLVYDATATTLSLASSLSPDLFWTTGTGTWDATALWSKTPDGTADSTFVEEGNITFAGQTDVTVTLATPETTCNVTIKDGDYTFAGETMTIIGNLAISKADATFQDGADLKDAAVTVGADSTLTIGKDTTMKSLSNEGTLDLDGNSLSISAATAKGGTVNAKDVTLTGANAFTKLTASGKVSGASALTVGDGSSMGSLADGTALTTDGAVTIKADTKLASLDNSGTLDLDGNSLSISAATAKGGTVNAKDVTLTGANTFTKLTASGKVSGASALTVGDGSSMGSLADGTALTTDGAVTIKADTKLASLDNSGTLDLNGNSLSIAEATAKGGTVNAKDITLTGANTFTKLTASGKVSGASALTVGDGSSMGSLTGDTDLTVAGGTVTIGADTTLSALTNNGALDLGENDLTLTSGTTEGGTVSAGAVTLTGDNTFTQINVNGGTLTLDGTLGVTGELAGVSTLIANELPTDGLILTAAAITNSALTLVTTEDALRGLNINGPGTWTLAHADSLLTTEFTLSLNGGDATGSVVVDDYRYSLSAEAGDLFILRMRGGNEWLANARSNRWDGSDDMWAYGAPSETVSAMFLGSGVEEVEVVGTQTAKSIVVDTTAGEVQHYTLTGDAVLTGDVLISSGGLTVDNTLTVTNAIAEGAGNVTIGDAEAGAHEAALTVGGHGVLAADHIQVNGTGSLGIEEGGQVVTDTITMEDGAAFANKGVIVIENGSLAPEHLANNEGIVGMQTLSGSDGDVIGGHIVLSKGGVYSGAYLPGTHTYVAHEDAALLQYVDGNMTIGGNAGTHVLVADAGHKVQGGIKTTGADVVLDNMTGTKTETITLTEASSMQGGKLVLEFSADNASKNSGNKAKVDKAFTGAALSLKGVNVELTQAETQTGQPFELGDTSQLDDVVLYTISDSPLSTFDADTKLTVNAPKFTKYYTNFALQHGSIYVVADRELNYYGKRLNGKTPNGKAGIAMAGNTLGLLAPQELNHREQYKDIAAVMDALDACVATKDSAKADKLAAAFAGSAIPTLGAAFSGDMDRQLRSLRNRTMMMGVSDATIMDPGLPSLWFNTEGDYRRVAADGTAAGFTLKSWGATVGTDYNFNSNFSLGLSVTAMYGSMSVNSPETVSKADLDTYYASAVARYASGAWTNTFIATFGVADAALDRTVDTGFGSYTTDGSTSGTAFGLLYELAYTIPMDKDAATCLQPVFNVAYKHVSIKGYTEKKSDAGLTVDGQSMDAVTFGAGLRMQTTIGESLLNRASVLEMRALAKVETGDLSNKADVSLAVLPSSKAEVESGEADNFGVELGASLFIPVGVESGTLFFDISAEIRRTSPNVTGTVGYRLTF